MSAGGPFAPHKWLALFADWKIFAGGLLYTLVLALGALLLALLLGLVSGLCSSSHWRALRAVSRAYVAFFQNTPLLIQVFFVYFGLPLAGIVLDVWVIGILCVGVYHGAYISEVVRSGVRSITKEQMEAAFSQGFTYTQSMRHVVLPQAWRVMLPPLANQAVNLIKNTSVIAIISGADIMFAAKSWSSFNVYYGPAYAVAGLLYFALCFPLASWARRMENNNKKAFSR
jgi:putative glutamine transport system permease protein